MNEINNKDPEKDPENEEMLAEELAAALEKAGASKQKVDLSVTVAYLMIILRKISKESRVMLKHFLQNALPERQQEIIKKEILAKIQELELRERDVQVISHVLDNKAGRAYLWHFLSKNSYYKECEEYINVPDVAKVRIKINLVLSGVQEHFESLEDLRAALEFLNGDTEALKKLPEKQAMYIKWIHPDFYDQLKIVINDAILNLERKQ